jgi:hypothetical protein
MVATLNPPKKRVSKIPEQFIYETMNGKHYYYKGYKTAIKNKQNVGSIMGYGLFQWMIIDIVVMHLKLSLPKNLLALGGEGGFHLGLNENLSIDVAILDKKDIDFSNIQNKYLHFAPKAVIEVDTKADFDAEEGMGYYMAKTQKMLDFGVEQVIWIFTNSKKILVARQGVSWLTVNWSDDIEVLDISLNLTQLLESEGFTNF